MDTNMRNVFEDPARRRFWLLIKALETTPFRGALALAKGAEAFLTEGADRSQEIAVADSSTAIERPTWLH